MRYTLLCLLLALSLMPAAAVATDTGYAVCYEDFMANVPSGGAPTVLYSGKTKISLNMRVRPDRQSESLGVLRQGARVQIFGYDQEWLFCWDADKGIYYVPRQPVDVTDTVLEGAAPYGVVKNRFVAVTATETALRTAPDESAEALATYPADTRISAWHVEDGWAVVPYRREVGYLYVGDLKELTPVAPTVEYAQKGDILAAFTTFYSVKQTELNIGRMENIRVGSNYISQVYQPGDVFDFNRIAGPYRKSRGYMDSPVLIDGQTVAGSGGGTCQVSTTLYNALLQLPEGLTVLYRHPHGPSGASYAPHGVDAAVGRDGGPNTIELNLEFRNDFDFPIAIDCSVQNGSLCIAIRKAG